MNSEPEFQVPEKFKNLKADVILRSSDKIDFRAYRLILSTASPVFEDMFQIPSMQDAIQVIPMEESAFVVSSLLQLCYPMDDPVVQPLQKLNSVLEALVKYQIDDSRPNWIKRVLAQAAEDDPLGVYAIALSLGRKSSNQEVFDEIIRLAARVSLRFDMGGSYAAELALISVSDYYRLMQYHLACKNLIIQQYEWEGIVDEAGYDWSWNTECYEYDYDRQDCPRFQVSDGDMVVDPRKEAKWWPVLLAKMKLELSQRPSGHVIKTSEFWSDAVEDSIFCSSCRRRATSELPEFSAKISHALEKQISHVQLNVRW